MKYCVNQYMMNTDQFQLVSPLPISRLYLNHSFQCRSSSLIIQIKTKILMESVFVYISVYGSLEKKNKGKNDRIIQIHTEKHTCIWHTHDLNEHSSF